MVSRQTIYHSAMEAPAQIGFEAISRDKVYQTVAKQLERHITECPNCWVIADTTRRTIQIYKGMAPYPIPSEVENRLMAALEKKMAAKPSK